MAITRDISFPTHAALELGLGLITLVAPAVFGASDIGIVAGVLFGATLIGMAVNAIGVLDRREDGPAMPVNLHHLADRYVGLGLVAAAVLLGLAGDAVTAAILAGVAVADWSLELSTRYSVS